MRLAILSFVAGVCAVQTLPCLPPCGPALAFGAGLLLLAARWLRGGVRASAIAATLGAGWALWHGANGLAARLPPALDGTAFRVEGRVLDLPRRQGEVLRFDFAVETIAVGTRIGPPLRRLALADYGTGLELPPGSRCTLHVRLRVPRGLVNPAGGDHERWLFAQRIDATGYLIRHPANRCAPLAWRGALARLRARTAAAIAASVDPADTAGVLGALAVGERAAMTDRQWQVLAATGTTHMVSISGLHVSLVAAAVFAAARGAWSLWPACTRRAPAQFFAAGAGLAAAAAYSLLAGFTVPTQRTLLMLACLYWQRRRGRHLLDADGILVALGLVTLADPLAVLTASFWLSFGAVACLALAASGLREGGFVRRVLGMHLWLGVALVPALALLSPLVAWTSPLANLVAVPLVTFGVVPLALVGTALALTGLPGAPACWRLAGGLWDFLWAGLSLVADSAPALHLPAAPSVPVVALCALGLGALWLPLSNARFWLAPLLCASLWLVRPPPPTQGGFSMTVYDVGQGLAVLVRTREHALLYDAGPLTRGGRDLGASVVVPNLRAVGIARLDALVLSHDDSDHAGGADAVLREIPVGRLLVSPSSRRAAAPAHCLAGERWRWDGVDFEILHPAPADRGDENALSCVLAVRADGGRALLSGDIDAAAEAALLSRAAPLASEVLVTPHHGSRSSSSPAFVAAVRPAHALHSAGQGNRYGFPAPAVVARYAAAGSRQLTTGAAGALEVRVGDTGLTVRGRRAIARRYWRAP
jgi:competence protein ComEC